MNIHKIIKKAYRLTREENYPEIELLSRQVLKKKPNNFDALFLLGTALSEMNNHQDGINYLTEAIKKNSKNSSVYNNLGLAYIKTGQYEKAIAMLKESTKLNQDDSEVFNNIGNAFFNLKKYKKAEKYYIRSIKIKGSSPLAMDNLGTCYVEQGRLMEAVDQFLAANDIDPELSSVYPHLASTLMLLHSTDDAERVIEAGLMIPVLTLEERYVLLTFKAIVNWLNGKLALSKDAIDSLNQINTGKTESKIVEKNIPFKNYIELLLLERSKNPDLYKGSPDKPIFFISESHCLTPSEIVLISEKKTSYRILSIMVQGCKAYHLAAAENNKYKTSVNSIITALPPESLIIVGFGEIDCRINEGFLPAYLEKGIDYISSIPTIIEKYMAYILTLSSSFNHRLVFYGVPAPSPSSLKYIGPKNTKLLCEIIELFNNSLKDACVTKDIAFVDLFNSTVDQNGVGKEKYFIDDYHLHPRFIPEFLSTCLTRPNSQF